MYETILWVLFVFMVSFLFVLLLAFAYVQDSDYRSNMGSLTAQRDAIHRRSLQIGTAIDD